MKPAIVLLSGGQDSCTCLAWAQERFDPVTGLILRYGQRHEIETYYAMQFAGHRKVKVMSLSLGHIGPLLKSSLTDLTLPVGTTGGMDGLPSTFTPGRNLVFLTLAASIGVSEGTFDIVTGVCQTDYSGYPDCRREFVDSFEQTFNLALGRPGAVCVHTPLMDLTKAETFALASQLGVLDDILTNTMTCYYGVEMQNAWGRGCGECPACILRSRGFDQWINSSSKRTSAPFLTGV